MHETADAFKVWWEHIKERTRLEDLRTDGRIEDEEIIQEFVNWTDLTQDRERLWALVNTVLKFMVP